MTQDCGCPDAATVSNPARHEEYHQLVTEQTGIPRGTFVGVRELQAARGMKTEAPNMHKIQERHRQQGKTASRETRERLRG